MKNFALRVSLGGGGGLGGENGKQEAVSRSGVKAGVGGNCTLGRGTDSLHRFLGGESVAKDAVDGRVDSKIGFRKSDCDGTSPENKSPNTCKAFPFEFGGGDLSLKHSRTSGEGSRSGLDCGLVSNGERPDPCVRAVALSSALEAEAMCAIEELSGAGNTSGRGREIPPSVSASDASPLIEGNLV